MPAIKYTPDSRFDLSQILLYIRRSNPRAARRVHRAVMDTLQMLLVFPMSGQERPEFGARLRSIPVKKYSNYLVFYQPITEGIEVIRIIHGARNLQQLF